MMYVYVSKVKILNIYISTTKTYILCRKKSKIFHEQTKRLWGFSRYFYSVCQLPNKEDSRGCHTWEKFFDCVIVFLRFKLSGSYILMGLVTCQGIHDDVTAIIKCDRHR